MTTFLLSMIVIASFTNAIACIFALRFVFQAKRRMQALLEDFFIAEGENPSQFAVLIDKIAEVIAARIGTTVMAAIRGALGGVQKGVNAEVQARMIEESPALGLVDALAPKLSKKLGKNPVLLAGLQSVLGGLFGGGSGSTANASSQTKSNHRRWDIGG